MINIVFIVHTASGGGAERVATILAGEFASRAGYSSSLISFYPVSHEYPLADGVTLQYLFEDEEAYRNASRLTRLCRLRKCVKALEPTYVIPFLWYVCVYSQISLVGTKTRIIATVRNNPAVVPSSALKRMLRNISILLAWKGFVQTDDQKQYFGSLIRRKLFVIPNPVSPVFLGLDIDPSRAENVIMIGRLERQKCHETMLDACRLLCDQGVDLKVRIFGEGGKRNTIQSLINANNLSDRCILEGRTDNVPSALSDAAVYVLTSSYEGMPNSLMEAMAAGVPCISTNCPTGPSELIENGVNGFLIEVGDSASLAKRIEQLLSNPSLRTKMGSSAKEAISDRFSPSKIADRIEAELLGVVSADAFAPSVGE